MMNTLKKAAIGAGIALTTMFAANKDADAQQLARNDNPTRKTELVSTFTNNTDNADKTKKATSEADAKKSAAIIKEGKGGEASFYSLKNDNIFVLSISGGTKGINGEPQEAYTAKTYAELLQKEFAKYGEDVAVFYTESKDNRATGVLIRKDGKIYDRNTETFVHDPKQGVYHPFILHGDIPKIIASQKPSAPSVALN